MDAYSNPHVNGNGGAYGKKYAAAVCINDAIPKELLLKIFSYMDFATLGKCAQVCKFWHECAFDGSNWKSIDLFQFQCGVKPHVVEKIAQRCRGFLREVTLKGCRKITDEAIRRFTELCQLIEILDLTDCDGLTNETCSYLGRNCPELTRLSLASCDRIDDNGLIKLSRCTNLTHLDVSWCVVGDKGITAIAESCPSLQRVRATGCKGITSAGVGELAAHAHGLLLLSLNYCYQSITDEALVHLAIGCIKLRILSVSNCSITDSGLRALAGTLIPTAAAAILSSRANHPATVNGASHRHRLRSASSNGVGDAGTAVSRVRLISQCNPVSVTSTEPPTIIGCRQLTVLEVAHCDDITDVGLATLTKNCPMLEKLDLEECGHVTDATLGQLALHCPKLNSLVLSHCDLITDAGIAKLANGLCGADHLQRLEMDNCPLLTDTALEHLGGTCRHLRQLGLYDCQLITKQGIELLSSQYSHLQVQAYFAPGTPPGSALERRRRYCRCCTLF